MNTSILRNAMKIVRSLAPVRSGRLKLMLLLLLAAASGCTRAYYRQQADNEAYQLLENGQRDPRWQLGRYKIDVDPRSRFDRRRVRAIFEGLDVEVSTPTTSRRNGRRFVHVRVDAERLADLQKLAPFAWSSYTFARRGEVMEFRQVVGGAAGKPVGDVGWTGKEIVYGITSLPADLAGPAQLNHYERRHWVVEVRHEVALCE